MTDGSKEVLDDMIIGKAVKDSEDQRYVRKATQDVVYVVELDPEKLTTEFEQWIEDDLLKINAMDIRKLNVKDYSAEMMFTLGGIQMDWDRRGEMTLKYDNANSQWEAESLKKFDAGAKQYADYTMSENQELNTEVLNELTAGLDDLLIVDVERKPAGLSADLKAGDDFLKDNDAATSLMTRGFAPVAIGPNKQSDILSTEGEVVASLADGVEYVLRFGNLQLESDGETPPPAAEEGEEPAAGDNINRYLFVMARFNEDLIEKPELDELPELPADAEETAEEPAEESTEAEDKAAESDADAPASEEADAEKADAEKSDDDNAADEKADDEKTDDEAAETSDETAEAVVEAAEQEAKEKELADIIAARKSIEQENQRRLDEYQAKLKAGRERVAELNERFGDWYYVISNDVYQKIHVSLDKLVKDKEAATSDDAAAEGGVPGLPNLPLGGGIPAP